MENEIVSATLAIQSILAPAVMITAVALLLLSLNARHSVLVNRIRLLDEEKRELKKQFGKDDELDEMERLRLKSIVHQLDLLLPCLSYVKNGILGLVFAILFFVLSSLMIGLGYFVLSVSPSLVQAAINVTFIGGMLLVFAAVVFLAVEMRLSYKVIFVEVKEGE